MNEIKDIQIELQQVSDKNNLDMNLIGIYTVAYEIHKYITGSYKQYVCQPKYDSLMQQRYDYCICMMNETLENKLEFERTISPKLKKNGGF